ncbi:YbaM family protein [Psychrosphaera aestuarii]|uniref:YbaM family protein n=1 Tax=Psychrosphaera aestuarii TaxID=1266052 RepID=UPI001FD47E5E|nr:YbaM family protein [Psychrosphaera aestuarii]
MSDIEVAENPLANAPEHVQLAVDLIMLLENNNVDNHIALQAIEIVKADLLRKVEK